MTRFCDGFVIPEPSKKEHSATTKPINKYFSTTPKTTKTYFSTTFRTKHFRKDDTKLKTTGFKTSPRKTITLRTKGVRTIFYHCHCETI